MKLIRPLHISVCFNKDFYSNAKKYIDSIVRTKFHFLLPLHSDLNSKSVQKIIFCLKIYQRLPFIHHRSLKSTFLRK